MIPTISSLTHGAQMSPHLTAFLVNIASAVILGRTHDHAHEHSHGQSRDHAHGGDTNLRAAYVHVIADAFTSVTAIVALLAGYFSGNLWIDSVMGLLGSAVIIIWAAGMLSDTTAILADYISGSCDLPQAGTPPSSRLRL